MHTLPKLVTCRGDFHLPLADSTAERLVGALLEIQPERRREAFRAALAGDPGFAIWTLVQAAQQAEVTLRSVESLAGWLAEAAPSLLLPLSHSQDCPRVVEVEEFSEPAGCSLAVAELAGLLADAARGDEEHAYLLGLVHLAPAWLTESAAVQPVPHPFELLPNWLLDASCQYELPRAEQSLEAACVAQAMALVFSRSEDAWRAMDCDPVRWIGRWEVLGSVWARRGPWGARLGVLLDHLSPQWLSQVDRPADLEAAKLEAIKEFAYGAGHEINNPLANISARAQTLLSEETDPERRRTLAAINSQAFRAHEMIADMMLFARPPEPNWQAVDLTAIVRTVVSELSEQAREQQTELAAVLPETGLQIDGDPTQLAVALRSLCMNGLEALVGGGRMDVELLGPTAEESRVRLRVSDDGPGIPAEVRPKIFEPYFSGREAGRGLGLGLSKCWRIVTMHGGEIDVADRRPQGTVFTIRLPVNR